MMPTTIATVDQAPFMPAIEWVTTAAERPEMPRRDTRGTNQAQRNEAITAGEYVAINRSREFGHHFSKLQAIRTDQALWPEDGEAPTAEAIAVADRVLRKFEDDMLTPSRVVATVDGGVAICFVRGDAYADVECFNDGVVLGATTNGSSRPVVWEIEPSAGDIARASDRIRKFFITQSPSTDGAEESARREQFPRATQAVSQM